MMATDTILKTGFLFLLIVFVSCRHAGQSCDSSFVQNDSILVRVKTIFPTNESTVRNSKSPSNNEKFTDQHFLVRIEKKSPFSSDQNHYLNDAVKDDFILESHGATVPRKLFVYEAMFPTDNVIQFMLVYAALGNNESKQETMHIHSRLLGFDNISLAIPNCL
ncbi:MAG: hypothetical protein WBP41_13770 [Saprospiraceae bacterium]